VAFGEFLIESLEAEGTVVALYTENADGEDEIEARKWTSRSTLMTQQARQVRGNNGRKQESEDGQLRISTPPGHRGTHECGEPSGAVCHGRFPGTVQDCKGDRPRYGDNPQSPSEHDG